MSERGFAAPVMQILRGSGLDPSGGTEFIQRRIALFAKILASISVAFLVINAVIGVALDVPLGVYLTSHAAIAHMAGLAFITTIWLVCRRGQYSLALLGLLDAASLIGCGVAWAFFIDPQIAGSIYSSMLSVMMTVLTRAIVIPSKAARTLRINLLAVVPFLVTMALWLDAVPVGGATPMERHAPLVTVINALLLLTAVISMATITSRIIYDLRRTAREAKELGPYMLEEKLGAGGMGEVWRARHRFLVRAAAVKLIRPELIAGRADPDLLLRRFEREARATAALRSPHTVQLYDFGQAEDGTLFYVMEMLVGIDLEKLVSRFGPVPAERAIHILAQVCHSLNEAHQNGLIHRDVKPANIYVSGIGSELDFVKVLDFGLVRLMQARPDADQVKLTAEGSVGGTPAYAAPEIVLGDASYDHRVDIYAVGCVGYWLLTGKLVFEGDTPMKVMLDHARTPPPRPQTRTELPIPPELEQIIMDCLEKDPERRPASAAALALRLRAVEVAQEWTSERAERWWQLHLPEHVQERPVADVLLSQEGSPAGVRELRPRRAAR